MAIDGEEEKDCSFQYYRGDGHCILDVTLITRSKADKLWREHIPYFVRAIQNGDDGSEICIWKDCDNNINYHKIAKDFHAGSCKVIDGRLYELAKL